MKSFLFVFAFLMSFGAFAETPVVFGKNVTCQELKDTLTNYGSVTVRARFLGIPTRETVYETVECRGYRVSEKEGSFITKDSRNCRVGKYCFKEIDENFPRCHTRVCP